MPSALNERDIRRTIILILTHLIPFYLAFIPISDPDIWWHLAAGEWIWTQGAFPTVDPFSWGGEKIWLAYSWGFELAVYGLYQMGGMKALSFFKALLAVLITWRLYLLLRYLTPDFTRAAALIPLGLYSLASYFTPRPWLFTVLFSLLEFEILFRVWKEKNPRYLLWLIPLFALWANIHIQFIYGIGILGLFFLAIFSEQKFTSKASSDSLSFWWYGLALIPVFLATLLNPYHFQLYQVIWLYAGQSEIYSLISELLPLQLVNLWTLVIFLMIFAGFWKLGKSTFSTLLPYFFLPIGAFLALRMVRDGWFLALVVLFLFTSAFDKKQAPDQERSSGREKTSPYTFGPLYLGLALTIILLGVLLITTGKEGDFDSLSPEGADFYPVQAVEFIKKEKPPGPLFNHFDWGGYLIWHLAQYQVSFDGRTNVHGASAVLDHFKTWRGRPIWRENRKLHQSRLVLAPIDKPLTSILRLHPDYEIIYEDKTAVVFTSSRGKASSIDKKKKSN